MTSLVARHVVLNQRTVFYVIVLGLLCYFVMMDTVLYATLQSVNLIDEKPKTDGEIWSPFHPMSMKLLMSDHFTHYIFTPLSEYFNAITKFSDIFYFATPNMITFTHLTIGFISARFVSSECLHNRRIGVLLFEFRSALDAFDGTIFRSHARNKSYESNDGNIGFWVDFICDAIAVFAHCFGIIFYLWKWYPSMVNNSQSSHIQLNTDLEKANTSEHHGAEKTKISTNTKVFLFWKVFCFGVPIGLSGSLLEQLLEQYTTVFMTPLDPHHSLLQSQLLHSNATWVIFWLWRVMQGPALLQVMLIAVFVDKVWELLRITKYFLFIGVGILATISWIHVHGIRVTLGLVS